MNNKQVLWSIKLFVFCSLSLISLIYGTMEDVLLH